MNDNHKKESLAWSKSLFDGGTEDAVRVTATIASSLANLVVSSYGPKGSFKIILKDQPTETVSFHIFLFNKLQCKYEAKCNQYSSI
jgi:hypothetical protein